MAATTAPQQRVHCRFQTDDEYEEEQLLMDIDMELQKVQTLKTQTHDRIEQLRQEQKLLEQQQRRLQRQTDRRDAGAATARMFQLQEKERERLAAAQAQRRREEQRVKAGAEAAERRREHAIETDKDLDDLDAFLAQDATNY